MLAYVTILPHKNIVAAQDTQIPSGWVKFDPHSHGQFDVHDENDDVVGTIDESHLAGIGFSTGDTVEMIRDDFGADGVMVTGCKLDECHYISGNYRAKERIETMQHLMNMIGLGAERLGVEWLSAA